MLNGLWLTKLWKLKVIWSVALVSRTYQLVFLPWETLGGVNREVMTKLVEGV